MRDWGWWLLKYLTLYTGFLVLGAEVVLYTWGATFLGVGFLALLFVPQVYYGALVYATILILVRNGPLARPLAVVTSPAAVYPLLSFPPELDRERVIVLIFAVAFGFLTPLPPMLLRGRPAPR